jgi:hypothetical protein
MSETRHTPTPWMRGGGEMRRYNEMQVIRGANKEYIAKVNGPTHIEDGDFIVRAVNSHQALVDVCRQLDEFQRTYHGYTQNNMPGNEHYSAWLMRIVEAARAALQHAEAR